MALFIIFSESLETNGPLVGFIVFMDLLNLKSAKFIFSSPLINAFSELNITIQISNFSDSNGGLWKSIILGNRNILVKERENKIALDLFLIGFSLLISIYNLSLYIFRPKDNILLYFSIFSIILSVRLLTSGEKFIFNLMPELPFEISFY